MRFVELEAVTVDGFGTLLELDEPVARLQEALAEHGVVRAHAEIAEAFTAEVHHYKPRAERGRDESSLAALRLECVQVFLDELGATLEAGHFVGAFLQALVFMPVEGAVETLERLGAAGVRLAVAANWDYSLPSTLERLELLPLFGAVVTSAEAGAPKPDPAVLLRALARLGVEPHRALHVGDEPVDERAARAAGMHFLEAPLAGAFEGWS